MDTERNDRDTDDSTPNSNNDAINRDTTPPSSSPKSPRYSPTSPSYSPKSPRYNPTSPSPSPPPAPLPLNDDSSGFWDPSQDFGGANPVMVENPADQHDSGYVEGEFDFTDMYKRLQMVETGTSTFEPTGDSSNPHREIGQEPPRKRRRVGHTVIKALDWTRFIVHDQNKFIGGGGFGDVFEGEWKNLPTSELTKPPPRIVVKRFKVAPATTSDIDDRAKVVLREIAVWHLLRHENVVPFVGVYHSPGFHPCLVSEWMHNGGVKEYVTRTPSVCLLKIIRGVIRGVSYLHERLPGIIHGDIKADNVLVNRRGDPAVCDFGLSRVLEDNSLWNTSATHAKGTMRWMSPELLDATQPTVTVASDIYAYAMACYEIMTGFVPFHEHKTDFAVIIAICSKKERPQRDAACITDDVWNVMQSAWANEPSERPVASKVLELLEPHSCEEDLQRCIFRDSTVES